MSIVFPCQVDISGTDTFQPNLITTLTPEKVTVLDSTQNLRTYYFAYGIQTDDTLTTNNLISLTQSGLNISSSVAQPKINLKTSVGDGGSGNLEYNQLTLKDVNDIPIVALGRNGLGIGTSTSPAESTFINLNEETTSLVMTTGNIEFINSTTTEKFSRFTPDVVEFYTDTSVYIPTTMDNLGFRCNSLNYGIELTNHNISGFYVKNSEGIMKTKIEESITTTSIIAPTSITTGNTITNLITDKNSATGENKAILTSTPSGILWNTVISPVNISDTSNAIGTNGQVLTKQTAGIQWSPNFPNIATYKRAWATTSVNITNANTLLYTSDSINAGTATATFLITFQMTASSSANHSVAVTIGRGTVTPATDQAFNLAKPGANNLTATIAPFGSNLGIFGGGQTTSTSTISFTDTPGTIGLYYYSIWCFAVQGSPTTQWSNFNIIQIKP
jgi:hypothetical protein